MSKQPKEIHDPARAKQDHENDDEKNDDASTEHGSPPCTLHRGATRINLPLP